MVFAVLTQVAIFASFCLDRHSREERPVKTRHDGTHRLVDEVFSPIEKDVSRSSDDIRLSIALDRRVIIVEPFLSALVLNSGSIMPASHRTEVVLGQE